MNKLMDNKATILAEMGSCLVGSCDTLDYQTLIHAALNTGVITPEEHEDALKNLVEELETLYDLWELEITEKVRDEIFLCDHCHWWCELQDEVEDETCQDCW